MKAIFGLLFAALTVTGCTTSPIEGDSNALRESDLRTARNHQLSHHLYMDLATVQRQLYIHREACSVEVVFKKEPRQVHFATVLYGPAEAIELKDQVMLDLTVYGTGKLGIDGYAYYAANAGLVRDLIAVLENPTVCPEGISPNLAPNPYVNMTPSIYED